MPFVTACHNYTGHNYTGHDNTGHDYTGHGYIGRTYIGHNCLGHNYIGVGMDIRVHICVDKYIDELPDMRMDTYVDTSAITI